MNPEGNFAQFYKNEKDFFLWIIHKEEGPFEFRIRVPIEFLSEDITEWAASLLKSKKIDAELKDESSSRFPEKATVIAKIEDKLQAKNFFTEAKYRYYEFFGNEIGRNAYVELKMDIDKLEAYADQAAEDFKKDELENGKDFALRNQFKEVKPP